MTAEALAARILATAEALYEAGAPSGPVIDDPRIERYQQWRDEPLTQSEQRDRQRRVDAELAERWSR